MCTRVIVVCLCVCVYVCVCSQSASCVGHFYSKLSMAIRFSEAFKICNLQICLKCPDFGVQVSHFVHMAIIAVLAWCMAALQGEKFHVVGHAR